MRILVLYSEMAGYFLACVRHHVATYGGEFHIVRWPVNPEAPFQFEDEPGITYYERRDLDNAGLEQLAQQVQPDVVYVTGWIDRPYLKVAKRLRRQGIPVVAAFDAQWHGNRRQKIAVAASPFFIRPCFSHAWVPGLWQYEYARRLGFPREQIEIGMYSADVERFWEVYEEEKRKKEEQFPRKFLFVGRLHEIKGLWELLGAWKELWEAGQQEWSLDIYGAGPLRDELPGLPGVTIREFVQPDQLPELTRDAGVFLLPSRYDPWAVTLHEFSAAGMPVIASHTTGATTAFLRTGYNGWLHQAEDQVSLKAALQAAMESSDAALNTMGRRSHELSQQISPATWAATLNKIAGS